MNFLILSDSHRRSDNITRAVRRNMTADTILFLGDGIDDFGADDRFMSIPLYRVRGNCDLFSYSSQSFIPEELILHFEEYTVMMMHGHRHGVKSSYELAAEYAASKGADILLFGHTHIPTDKYFAAGTVLGQTELKKPLYIFNPGSIGTVSAGYYSFGTLSLSPKGVLFGHGKL